MEKYGQFICNADGIIMIMDPRQFTDLVYLGDDDEDITSIWYLLALPSLSTAGSPFSEENAK